uniref:Conserved oligomeric Golgi complex subunit 8 n=1 Tax=Trypanosoma congolense (strain IL3000) TaxID=1068625 RepID=G0V221_TRYCI|nr:unnamed protein product [Trypanosoma congolense IL3000]
MDTGTNEELRVRTNIIEAMVQNFPLLLHTREVNVKVATSSDNALSCVTRLNDSLAKLQTLSQTMGRVGQLWRREKQIALRAVEQHQKLLAFLEVPSVLKDCIRNEMYHEALVVLNRIMTSAQSVESLELFCRVRGETLNVLQHSLEELVLPRLAQQLTVASAVKLTAFLRRLGVEEQRIRWLFLLKRAEYVDGYMHEAVGTGTPYLRIFRYLTGFKVHVSEVVLQYTACFSADAGDSSSIELVGWCHERSFAFLERLRACLERISNGSELASVIEQCSNCASAAALVHMDVSGIINQALSSRVKSLFAEQISLATQSYSASMATFSWRPPSDAQQQPLPRDTKTAAPRDATPPPVSLLQWLPLAYALNGILTAFNTIRKCVIPGIELFCVAKVAGLLRIIAKDLTRDRGILMAVEGGEKHSYLLFVNVFMHDFYFHVLSCVQELLGDDARRLLDRDMYRTMHDLRNLLPQDGTPAEEGGTMRASQNNGSQSSTEVSTSAAANDADVV